MRTGRICFGTLLLTVVAACGASSSVPTTPIFQVSPEAYVKEILDLMQQRSVHRKEIDWTSFRATVVAASASAKTIKDTFPAIKLALGLLNDHHSAYEAADGTPVSNPSFPPCFTEAPEPVASLPADVGYVKIPATNNSIATAYAAAVQGAIRSADTADVRGWIVDLRGNGGGSSYPMIAGIGPVLGDGVAGYFVDPEAAPFPWGYDQRGSWGGASHTVFVAVGAPYILRRPQPRVAVLTSRWVASAGEAVAVAFRGRPDTRTFGTATCGVPTGNSTIDLSDGGKLILTTGLDADRGLVAYDDQLPPDEVIADSSALVARAIAWLRGQ